MENKVNYTIVGAFVIILVAFIVLSIIWLSAGLGFQQYTTYKIYMKESVSGLSLDSPVEYNGVNVGTVRSIELNHDNPQQVELLVKIQNGTPITQGTRAMLNVRGLTGVAYIALEDKGTDNTALRAKYDEDYPVINTAPSLLLRLDTALTKLSDNVQEVSTSIRELLDSENLSSIKDILNNMNKISSSLINNTKQLNIIMDNTIKASRQLSPLIQSIELQTLPAANQAITNFGNVSQDISEITTTVKQNPSVLIRGKKPSPPGPGEQQ